MTTTWHTAIGVATVAMALLTGVAAAQHDESLVADSSRAGNPEQTDAAGASVSPSRNRATHRYFDGGAREQPLTAATPRVRRFFVQGGVAGCCQAPVTTALVFGGGGIASPTPNIRIIADANGMGEPGYGSVFYGSGALAYRFGEPNPDDFEVLVGAGVAVLTDGHDGSTPPQFVVGLGYKAAFFQYRAFPAEDDDTFTILLGGVKF